MDTHGDQPADTQEDRFLKLSEEDGIEAWLDFETGDVSYRAVQHPDEPTQPAAEGGAHMTDDDTPVNLGLLLGSMRNMLDQHEYRYDQLDGYSLHMLIRGASGLHRILLTADDNTGFVRVLGGYGAAIPEGRRTAVADAISRVNYTLMIGNFELDFADGDLRFRTSMDIDGGLFTEQVADTMLGCTLQALDRYADTFMRVAFGDVEPEEAIRDAA